MTEDQAYQRLLETIAHAGGQRPFAQQIGVTPSYINDIVNKRRLMSDRILSVIGIERIVTVEYREKAAVVRPTSVAHSVAEPQSEETDRAS